MANPWFDLAKTAYIEFADERHDEFDRDEAVPSVAAAIRARGLADEAITELAFRLVKTVDRFMLHPTPGAAPEQGTLDGFSDAELGRLISVSEGGRIHLGDARAAEAYGWVKNAETAADDVVASARDKRQRIENLQPWLDQGMTVREATLEFRRSH